MELYLDFQESVSKVVQSLAPGLKVFSPELGLSYYYSTGHLHLGRYLFNTETLLDVVPGPPKYGTRMVKIHLQCLYRIWFEFARGVGFRKNQI